LTAQDIGEFAHSLPRIKPVIFFSGGEPFLRPDFPDILRVIKKYKLKCGINTNAYLLDEGKIGELIGLNIELLIFSLFGPEPIHDRITGVKGSYAKVSENIRSFCAQKNKSTRVILCCVITKSNIDCLEEIPVIAKRLGADAVKFEHLNFLDNSKSERNVRYFACERDNLNMSLSDFTGSEAYLIERISKKLKDIKRKYGKFVFIKPDLSQEEIKNWYSNGFDSKRKCFFVWHSIFVRPDGTIVPCQFLQDYGLGNIKEHRLYDIIKSSRMVHLKKLLKKELLPECVRCCKL
jgi:MoaA/NifB/PqqE/SkfB family radical SAM enzyme